MKANKKVITWEDIEWKGISVDPYSTATIGMPLKTFLCTIDDVDRFHFVLSFDEDEAVIHYSDLTEEMLSRRVERILTVDWQCMELKLESTRADVKLTENQKKFLKSTDRLLANEDIMGQINEVKKSRVQSSED